MSIDPLPSLLDFQTATPRSTMGTGQLVTMASLLACHAVLGMTTPSPNSSEDRMQHLETVSNQLARQLMLQQLYVEEKTRSEGDSGLKQVIT